METIVQSLVGQLEHHARLALGGVVLLVLGAAIFHRLKVKTWLSPSWIIDGPSIPLLLAARSHRLTQNTSKLGAHRS